MTTSDSELSTLIVPGLNSSGAAHWQTWFEKQIPGAVRVVQRDWKSADLAAWASRVRREISRRPGRILIVAHSFGALAAAQAADDHRHRIAGALFVAPADPDKFGVSDLLPQGPLGFPAIVVASTNDPWLASSGRRASPQRGMPISSASAPPAISPLKADTGRGPAGSGFCRGCFLTGSSKQIGSHSYRSRPATASRGPTRCAMVRTPPGHCHEQPLAPGCARSIGGHYKCSACVTNRQAGNMQRIAYLISMNIKWLLKHQFDRKESNEMKGGGRKRRSLAAAAAGLLLSSVAAPAFAADLGGSCCADLEERIAELEATTARKGNRKVSLTVYGQVNQGVLFWDDGFESNAGVYTNDNSRTRVGFRGNAKINGEWSAGYRLELGVRTANSKRFTQDDPTGEAGIDLRDSHWYIESKSLGRATIGRGGTATDQITEINLTQTADFSKYSDVEDTGLGLSLRNSAGALSGRYQYRRLIGVHGDQPGDGERRFDGVTYLTPEWAGFTASATWANDDYWDVALRYAGEFGPFKVAAGIGYGEITDGSQTQTACAFVGGDRVGTNSDSRCNQFGGSISVLHNPTGLFVNAAAGIKKDKLASRSLLFQGPIAADDKQSFWAIQGGVEQSWTRFGKTTIYGEYYDYTGGSNNREIEGTFVGTGPGDAAVLSTDLRSYGFGIAQGFDAAVLTLYLSYRHVEGDLTASAISGGVATGPATAASLEDLDLVFAGGIIKF